MSRINSLLIIALSSVCLMQAEAAPLSEWLGSEVALLSANFNRYDIDMSTGEMQGPQKGHLELQRPGYLSLATETQQIKISNNSLEITSCAGCKPTLSAASEVMGKPLLELLTLGSNVDGLFKPQKTTVSDERNTKTIYSLASAGLGQRKFALWSYDGQPTVIEVSFQPGIKTILQLYGLKRTANDPQEKTK